jgi:hypothetical protein
METKLRHLMVICSIIAISGCFNSHKGDKDNLVFQENPNEEQKQLNTEDLSFQNIYSKVIEPKCLPCHASATGNKGHVNLESPYSNIYAQKEIILDEILSKSMPPKRAKSQLSQQEYDLITYWLRQGAPEFGITQSEDSNNPSDKTDLSEKPDLPTPTEPTTTPQPSLLPVTPETTPLPSVNPEPTLIPIASPNPVVNSPLPLPLPPLTDDTPQPQVNLDFTLVVLNVLEPYCIKCHQEFDNYDSVFKSRKQITNLVKKDIMPKDQVLPDDKKKILIDWINLGAQK